MSNLIITHTRPEHFAGIERITFPWLDPENMGTEHLRHHIRRFPEGQLVALLDNVVVAYCVTMRTSYSPYNPPLGWHEAIGDMTLRNHDPQGAWLYGVDFAVHPDYRRHGIGTQMYDARFDLIRRLNLRGFYAGGMLAGYPEYMGQMRIEDYANRVMRGEIDDPTVSMQMRRGFRPQRLIENYTRDLPGYRHAMLLVWENTAVVAEPAAAALPLAV